MAQVSDPHTPTRSGVSPGDVIAGRYHLTRRLATGGMASVWEATDPVLERDVAVKVLHPHLAADESFVARFRTEAVAAAKLRHANIVSIYDTCSEDGVEAIVLELVRGRTLRAYLDSHGPLLPAEAIHIVAEVADALAAAHRAGLVHRDIKPGNILIRDDGQVLVTDFGIAKLRDRAGDHTQTGMVVGTVKYLAPEQVEGRPVDARTDVYALGVVLYEALTGRPPFQAETDTATALARLHRDPLLPRQLRPGIPKELEAVVLRALARDPAGRYSSAAELRAALLAAPTSADPTVAEPRPLTPGARPTPAPPAAARPTPAPSFAQTERRWLLPTLFIVLVAAAMGVAGVLIGRTEAGQDLIDRARDVVADDGGGNGGVGADGPDQATISAVDDFDPEGDGIEHPELTGAAVDGDPATAWTTEEYSAGLSGLKPGVGLALELAEPGTIREVVVDSPSAGWSADIYVAETVGASLEDWGAPVASAQDISSGGHTFETGDVQGSAVLLWISGLGPERPAQVRINDVRVSS